MPRNKDQKRLIRARMSKTGESYTAARAVVVARKDQATGSDARSAAPRAQWPALAGMSDEAVKTKTGRTWAQWVSVLDEAGAHGMSHRDIARHVLDSYDVSHWWAQTVTVGYERIRGLRDVGQRRGGAYETSKSRTVATDVSTLYRMVKDARRRKTWLPDGVARVRTSVEDKSIRTDWSDGTRVTFHFTARGPEKSTLTVQHTGLATKADIARCKAFWDERLNALRERLTGTRPSSARRPRGR